ncbi:MAG TPA: twin-arginine translocation signal domain-containing protein [Bryobacteraceae bacterium]|nr:twin-arginine translocation signal domain-containing protein [Bryobacteraceae bacterium]
MTDRTRRRFLQTAAAAMAAAPLAAASEPVLGMIFPPANYPVPPEAHLLYPNGIMFLAEGVGFHGMTIESYDEAVPRIVPAALKLKQRGATAISIMGTSLTFYKGAAFNQQLIDQVHQATGLPATSMSSGIVDGLKVAGAKRIAVATAYTDSVNATLERFLTESGFEVAKIQGLNLIRATNAVTQERLFDFSAEVFAGAPRAGTLLISCGGLKTIDLLVPLEAKCKVPVVSSTPHALMNAVRLTGLSPRAMGYGSVLAKA